MLVSLLMLTVAAWSCGKVIGICEFPSDHPDVSPTRSVFAQNLDPGRLYAFTDAFNDCHGCVHALNLCYRPGSDNNEELLFTVEIRSPGNYQLVETQDIIVHPNIDRGNCASYSPDNSDCCIEQTLAVSFPVSRNHMLFLRVYGGTHSQFLRHQFEMTNGRQMDLNSGQYLDGSMIYKPFFFFRIDTTTPNALCTVFNMGFVSVTSTSISAIFVSKHEAIIGSTSLYKTLTSTTIISSTKSVTLTPPPKRSSSVNIVAPTLTSFQSASSSKSVSPTFTLFPTSLMTIVPQTLRTFQSSPLPSTGATTPTSASSSIIVNVAPTFISTTLSGLSYIPSDGSSGRGGSSVSNTYIIIGTAGSICFLLTVATIAVTLILLWLRNRKGNSEPADRADYYNCREGEITINANMAYHIVNTNVITLSSATSVPSTSRDTDVDITTSTNVAYVATGIHHVSVQSANQ